jgi:hypothetical protein
MTLGGNEEAYVKICVKKKKNHKQNNRHKGGEIMVIIANKH